MPLEQLERLFEQVGQAAEKMAALREGTGPVTIGGRVALSEAVHSIHDLYRQLGRGPADNTPAAQPQTEWREVVSLLRKLVSLQERGGEQAAVTKKTPSDAPRQPVLSRIPPGSWIEAGLKLATYVEKQERAGKAVDGFTRALAVASRFLYSFTTGRVITPSGQRIPWRRALARALRRSPGMRPLRHVLSLPDVILRRVARQVRIAQGGRAVPRLGQAVKTVGEVRSGIVQAGAGRAGQAAAARAAGAAAGRLAAGAGAGAGAGAAGAGGAAGAAGAGGAAAAGSALAAAGPVGAAIGAVVALVAILVAAVVALRKFTVSVRESAEALLQSRFSKYGALNPTIAFAEARYEAYDIQSRIREGQATAATTLALTRATIQLRQEMGPINRSLLNLQTVGTLLLVHVARAVNLLLRLSVIPSLLDVIIRRLGWSQPEPQMPLETFLGELERQVPMPRNVPPQGGLPPWQ